jgi:hypothetical protein
LKAIAAVRAVTMQAIIQKSLPALGQPCAASIAPVNANGSAKMECSHLIISSVSPTFRMALRTRAMSAPEKQKSGAGWPHS